MNRDGAIGTALALLFVPACALAQGKAGSLLTRLDEIGPAVVACWRAPAGLARFEAMTVTARFALRVDGSLIGPPRVSFAGLPLDTGRLRDMLTQSAVEAIEACTPVPISASLGRAIAGRVFAVRFVYRGPKGRGA